MRRYYAEGVRSRHAADRHRDLWKRAKGSVLIVGAGGLGSFLVANLLGTSLSLTVVDRDVVEESNLNRQFFYRVEDIGRPKAGVIAERTGVKGIVGDWRELDIGGYDVIVDCMDEWDEKVSLYEECLERGTPCFGASAGEGKGWATLITSIPPFHPRGTRSVSPPELSVTAGFLAEEIVKLLATGETLLRQKHLFVSLNPPYVLLADKGYSESYEEKRP